MIRAAAAILSLCALSSSLAASISTNGMQSLASFLEPKRKDLDLPAIAAAVVQKDRVIAAGAVGERKTGSGVSVTLNDRFHIGSCTKSMTALLAVELAREGKIRLDTRAAEVFPEWKLEGEKRDITLALLLQNRSGMRSHADRDLWSRAFRMSGPPVEQRLDFLKEFLTDPLEATPGSKYIYSNIGFALAGAMIERRAAQPWEQLIAHFIFEPLGFKQAGFGAPSSEGKIDQPWGHRYRDGKLVPIEPSDNPVATAPAGAVHLSVLDTASYAAFHLAAFNGDIERIKPYREQLYTPPTGSDYAFGWIVTKRNWAGGTVLTHAGSNTMFYAVIWIAPVKGYAFVVMTNAGDRDLDLVGGKVDKVVGDLIKEFVQ